MLWEQRVRILETLLVLSKSSTLLSVFVTELNCVDAG